MAEKNDLQLEFMPSSAFIQAGGTYDQLRELHASGKLERIRNGWYRVCGSTAELFGDSLPRRYQRASVSGCSTVYVDSTDSNESRYHNRRHALVEAAIRAGGTCGCLAAARVYGFWEGTSEEGTCVIIGSGVRAKAVVDQKIAGTNVSHIHHVKEHQSKLAIETPMQALRHIIQFHDGLTAACCVEAAVSKGFISVWQVDSLLEGVSQRKLDEGLKYLLWGAESCSETKTRIWCVKQGFKVKIQTRIPGYDGRFDIEIEPGVILEIDSQTYHGLPAQVTKDAHRDFIIRGAGKVCIRVTWYQIWVDWENTKRWLLRDIRAAQKYLKTMRRALAKQGELT